MLHAIVKVRSIANGVDDRAAARCLREGRHATPLPSWRRSGTGKARPDLASPAMTPQLRVQRAVDQLGRDEVIARCAALLAGAVDDVDFIVRLGGKPALQLLSSGVPIGQEYWLRVWAARGLLWAGPEPALDALRRALADDHWRVREMACKVAARHRTLDVLDAVIDLQTDPNERVARAATRAARRTVSAR